MSKLYELKAHDGEHKVCCKEVVVRPLSLYVEESLVFARTCSSKQDTDTHPNSFF